MPVPFSPSVTLKGHKDSVISLDVSSSSSSSSRRLVSGSEDGTARVWDLATNKTVHCLAAFNKNPVTSVCFDSKKEHLIHASSANSVSTFDLRTAGLLVRQPTISFGLNDADDDDEVNCCACNRKAEFISACDDAGNVFVIDAFRKKLHKSWAAHDNICTSVVFRPESGWDLISGGLDSQVCVWDFQKGRKKFSFSTATRPSGSGSEKQLINPPFVNHLSCSKNGKLLGAAVGDGSVRVFDLKARQEVLCLEGHGHIVSTLEFAAWSPNSAIVSASNDRTLVLWDVSRQSSAPDDDDDSEEFVVKRFGLSAKPNCLRTTVDGTVFVGTTDNSIVGANILAS